jgi:hypothetical protein
MVLIMTPLILAVLNGQTISTVVADHAVLANIKLATAITRDKIFFI